MVVVHMMVVPMMMRMHPTTRAGRDDPAVILPLPWWPVQLRILIQRVLRITVPDAIAIAITFAVYLALEIPFSFSLLIPLVPGRWLSVPAYWRCEFRMKLPLPLPLPVLLPVEILRLNRPYPAHSSRILHIGIRRHRTRPRTRQPPVRIPRRVAHLRLRHRHRRNRPAHQRTGRPRKRLHLHHLHMLRWWWRQLWRRTRPRTAHRHRPHVLLDQHL